MFTGIVQAIGTIVSADPRADGLRLVVDAAALGTDDIMPGDSIAVSGCCLTVVVRDGARLHFDVSAASLGCIAPLTRSASANLEKALRAGDRLGGHLVSGHVDGLGTVIACDPVGDGGGSVTLTIEAPAALSRFIATKGSIAVDGVSLTINAVDGARFSVNLIPHTLAATTLGQLARGRPVNLEVDRVALYVARLREFE